MLNRELKTEIEMLLRRYYAGDATPQETQRIAAFFRECGMSELDDSMRVDKLLFEQMEQICSEPEVPCDLESRIRAAIDADEMRRGFRISGRRFRFWAAAAVAAVLISVGVAIYLRDDKLAISSGMMADAVRTESVDVAEPVAAEGDIAAELPEKNAESEAAAPAKRSVRSTSRKVSGKHRSEEGTIIIVLDQEESDRISEEVLKMLQTRLNNSVAMMNRDKRDSQSDEYENSEKEKEDSE